MIDSTVVSVDETVKRNLLSESRLQHCSDENQAVSRIFLLRKQSDADQLAVSLCDRLSSLPIEKVFLVVSLKSRILIPKRLYDRVDSLYLLGEPNGFFTGEQSVLVEGSSSCVFLWRAENDFHEIRLPQDYWQDFWELLFSFEQTPLKVQSKKMNILVLNQSIKDRFPVITTLFLKPVWRLCKRCTVFVKKALGI